MKKQSKDPGQRLPQSFTDLRDAMIPADTTAPTNMRDAPVEPPTEPDFRVPTGSFSDLRDALATADTTAPTNMLTPEAAAAAARAEHDARFRVSVLKGTRGVPRDTAVTGPGL
jgi:hypothetical protein